MSKAIYFFSRFFSAVFLFLQEVKAELKKTSFPDRRTTVRHAIVVILFSLAAALFLGGLDMLFVYILNAFVL